MAPGRTTDWQRPIITEVVDLIKVQARSRVASVLWRAEADVSIDMLTDDLVAQIMGYVYGRNGQNAIERKVYYEANFPRWLPRRLRNKWSRRRSIEVDATPLLIWPDATFAPPDFGAPGRFLQVARRES